MRKKHFIALADRLRQIERLYASITEEDSERGMDLRHVLTEYRLQLADFCQAQSSQFNRKRWLSYIAGECGPNGGKR